MFLTKLRGHIQQAHTIFGLKIMVKSQNVRPVKKTCYQCNATFSWKRSLTIHTVFVNEGNSHVSAQCVM